MPEQLFGSNPSITEPTPQPTKRRRIRKGTQSCWECKRRKVRCTYVVAGGSICDGCKSRQTKCISQDYEEEVTSSRRADRLDRMESLLQGVVEKQGNLIPTSLSKAQIGQDSLTRPPQSTNGCHKQMNSDTTSTIELASSFSDCDGHVPSNVDAICRALIAVWPNQHDLDLMLSVPADVTVMFHGVICIPYSDLFSSQVTSPRGMLELPAVPSHPVFIARPLLLLGALIQGMPSSSIEKLVCMGVDPHAIKSRVVATASRLVTSNDEVIESVEGIECIMIESMYHNNAGNLRRAWLSIRRALNLAQVIGLHIGVLAPSTILDSGTRHRIKADYMWFRLITTDRYLSLMLGLPQGTLENVFASPEALESCTAWERLERMQAVVGGYILQRNMADIPSYATTRTIDKMLWDAADAMPVGWWLMTPNSDTSTHSNESKALEEAIRTTLHFAHHHLLVQLHLPHIMQPSSGDRNSDYSKMTAANASRAILAQFVYFRNSDMVASYCRGIDFVAFIACTVLCIVHIETHRQQPSGFDHGVSVLQALRHQRPSDRGLMQSTLDIMKAMAQKQNDAIAEKVVNILQPLLEVENDSVRNGNYHASADIRCAKKDFQCTNNPIGAASALHIDIPYFGLIKIEHRTMTPGITEPIQPPSDPSPAGYEIGTAHPTNTEWQAVPSHIGQLSPHHDYTPKVWGTSPLSGLACDVQEPQIPVPGLGADIDDWALQGVDLALFTSLAHSFPHSDDAAR